MEVRLEKLRRAGREWLRRAWARHAPRSFLLHARASSRELGAAGEELAARALRRAGFVLQGRRIHTPHAEVDLWARRAGVSWVIEVKTGRCARLPRVLGAARGPSWDLRWRPALSLDRAQRERLARAARYLGRRSRLAARVALVEVLVDERARAVEVLAPVELTPRSEARDW